MQNNIYNTNPETIETTHSKACNDVLKAINDLRIRLQEKQQSGNVNPDIAESMKAQLDSLTSSALNYQQKVLK